jgi:hypothetical protein
MYVSTDQTLGAGVRQVTSFRHMGGDDDAKSDFTIDVGGAEEDEHGPWQQTLKWTDMSRTPCTTVTVYTTAFGGHRAAHTMALSQCHKIVTVTILWVPSPREAFANRAFILNVHLHVEWQIA